MKKFIFGAWIGLVTWAFLSVVSAAIYNVTGNMDLLQAHPYMWSGSIAIMSFVVDSFILTKLS